MSILATLLLATLIWPFTSMWRAYCIILIWGWFVTPNYAVPAPSIYVLVGVLLLLQLCLPHQRIPKPEEGADPFSEFLGITLAWGFLWPGLTVGCAWAWKWLQWGV